jgi:hypothetical protein
MGTNFHFRNPVKTSIHLLPQVIFWFKTSINFTSFKGRLRAVKYSFLLVEMTSSASSSLLMRVARNTTSSVVLGKSMNPVFRRSLTFLTPRMSGMFFHILFGYIALLKRDSVSLSTPAFSF